MRVASALGGIAFQRGKRRGQLALSFTAIMAGVRIFRRLTRSSDRAVIRFAVKPGEVYEIRGLRRDR